MPYMNTKKRENPKATTHWFSPATTVYTVITGTLKLAGINQKAGLGKNIAKGSADASR
jgi:hypothetical protein